METDDNLDLYRLNAAAEITASRITNPTPDLLPDANEVLDNFLPTKPLKFEHRVELYFYLRLLEQYREKVKSVNPSEWQDKKLAQITEKKKEIEQCLLEVVIMQKPATPILDKFNELYANEDSQRKEDREKRDETVSKYGSHFLSLQDFINRVLLKNWGESSTLSAFCRLVDNGLIVYDNDDPVSFPQLLASLEHRKTQCLIDEDKDNMDFWDTLKTERNYQVKIDNVARAYYLAGNQTFDWYNHWTIDKDISIPIPDEIKADIKQSSVNIIYDDIDCYGELKPYGKLEPLPNDATNLYPALNDWTAEGESSSVMGRRNKIQQEKLEYTNLEGFLYMFNYSTTEETDSIDSMLEQFNWILDKGIPLRFSEKGYVYDDQFAHKGDVKGELIRIKIGKGSFDREVKTQGGLSVPLGKLLIKRSDIKAVYLKDGEPRYPWALVALPKIPQCPSDWDWFPTDGKLKIQAENTGNDGGVCQAGDDSKAYIEQVSTPSNKYGLRDIDFIAWKNEANPDFKKMTRKDVQTALSVREKSKNDGRSILWGSGFDDWWKQRPCKDTTNVRRGAPPKSS